MRDYDQSRLTALAYDRAYEEGVEEHEMDRLSRESYAIVTDINATPTLSRA